MKKLKWFTLVEILIVIVIIGILIWALVPRMQSAQWRARDVARKNDLAQLQAAIVTSQQDKWRWPMSDWTGGTNWLSFKDDDLASLLISAGINAIPRDPLTSNQVSWLGTSTGYDEGYYAYMLATKNWTTKWWFVLMAKTETEWWSNWVVCNDNGTGLSDGVIKSSSDIASELHVCTSVDKVSSGCVTNDINWQCKYTQVDQLRYVLTY